MTEINREDIEIVLGVSVLKAFPEETRAIISAIRIIKESIDPVIMKMKIDMSDEEIMSTIAGAICFIAVHGKLK